MLSAETHKAIVGCARDFDVDAVWLFGSALGNEETARDIDLPVEGLAPELFLKFYARLFFALPKSVDLLDLSDSPPLEAVVREKGVRIYERIL